MRSILSLLLCSAMVFSSCTYVQKIRDGKTAFERYQFAEAVKMLKAEFNKEKSRIEKGKKAYMIAESYRRMNQHENSIDWYRRAFDNSYGVDALKGYAYGLKRIENYEEAKQAFKELGIEIGSPYEYRREIAACQAAIDWRLQPIGEYEIKLADFNSTAADFSPSIYKDGLLVITSDRNGAIGDDTYKWTGNDFMDLFIIDPKSNDVENFSDQINTPNNEGTVAFNQDFTEMIFTRCFSDQKNGDNYCKLMYTRLDQNSWTLPIMLNFTEENVNYGHPSLSADGSTLYFASDHPDGWGGYDIYTSERTPDGWEYPRLMGRTINTTGDEMFPFIDADTLYFASDYHTGMGGLDIFRTYKLQEDAWAPVHNLRAPVNSGADDFGYIIDYASPKPEGVLQVGYFTSTRYDGKGNDDIYRFEKRMPPPPPPVDTTVTPEPIVYKMILEGYVLEKIYAESNNPNSKILGRKPLPGSKVQVNFGNKVLDFEVGEDGLFTFELEENRDYNFFASRENYLNNTANFSTKGIGKDPSNPTQVFSVEIVLDKIFKDREITLENIYYNYDKWDIRDDAKPTLDKLAKTLEQNPLIRIQLSSHTDCRGTNNYNNDLSQKRAQSVVDYLITKGIAAERLTAVGYGESNLEVECLCARCTEEEHQKNRRTTFKVLE